MILLGLTQSQGLMQGAPRSQDVPRRISELRRDLKIGQLWLVQHNEQPQAIRASLELSNRVIAAVTLNPQNGQPLALLERDNIRLGNKPSLGTMNQYLSALRQNTENLNFGAYTIPAPQGFEVQVYWSSKLVSYIYVNPSSGEAQTDQASSKEIQLSTLKVR